MAADKKFPVVECPLPSAVVRRPSRERHHEVVTLALALSGTTAAVAEEAWQQQEQAREQKAQQDLASVSRELSSARAKLAEAQRLSKELASQFGCQ